MSDYFIFGDIDTRNYEGIYVYFDDVDATPSRVGEFIDIPGRNGSFYLDKGRFEDITHTYDIIALTKEVGSNLINAIASKVGYHRLEDSFNPGEFYSAVFVSEIEPTVPTDRSQVTFKLMFTRKPQRFLTSGETAVTVSNGGTLTNPTLFDSQPLLMVNGDGDMELNGYPIHLDYEEVGYIDIMPSYYGQTGKLYFDGNNNLVNDGDSIVLPGFIMALRISIATQYVYINIPAPKTWISQTIPNYESDGAEHVTDTVMDITFEYGEQRFTKGVGQTSYTDEVSFSFQLWPDNPPTPGTARTVTLTCSLNFKSDNTNWVSFSFSDFSIDDYTAPVNFTELVETQPITALSTQTVLGTPTYIDCELGEAYKIVDGNMISLNRYLDLGSDLPMLSPGVNDVVIGQGIGQVKVVPRWWKV